MATKTTPRKAEAKPKAKAAKKTAVKPKEVAAKKAAVKPAAKPARKAAPAVAKSAMKKGTKYSCKVCGLVVAVDTACGCTEACDIFCCEKPMKVKK